MTFKKYCILLFLFFFLAFCKKHIEKKHNSTIKSSEKNWGSLVKVPNHHLPFHSGANVWFTENVNQFTGSYIPVTSNPNRQIHATYGLGKYGWDFGAPGGVELVASVPGCIRDLNDMGWTYEVKSRMGEEVDSWEVAVHMRQASKNDQIAGIQKGSGDDVSMQAFDTLYAESVNYVVLHWIDGSDKRKIKNNLGLTNGKLESLYMHLDKVYPWIRTGTCVKAGTPLGTIGSTGFVSGPHIHYQVQTFNSNMKHFYSPNRTHFFQQSIQVRFNTQGDDYNPDSTFSLGSTNSPRREPNTLPAGYVIPDKPPFTRSLAEQSFGVDDKSPWGLTDEEAEELKNCVVTTDGIDDESKKTICQWIDRRTTRNYLIEKYELNQKWQDFKKFYEVRLINEDGSLNLPVVEDFIVRQACDYLNHTQTHTCGKSISWLPSRFREFLIKCPSIDTTSGYSDAYDDCESKNSVCKVAAIGQSDICVSKIQSLSPE